jgi:hypothetical protein
VATQVQRFLPFKRHHIPTASKPVFTGRLADTRIPQTGLHRCLGHTISPTSWFPAPHRHHRTNLAWRCGRPRPASARAALYPSASTPAYQGDSVPVLVGFPQPHRSTELGRFALRILLPGATPPALSLVGLLVIPPASTIRSISPRGIRPWQPHFRLLTTR